MLIHTAFFFTLYHTGAYTMQVFRRFHYLNGPSSLWRPYAHIDVQDPANHLSIKEAMLGIGVSINDIEIYMEDTKLYFNDKNRDIEYCFVY